MRKALPRVKQKIRKKRNFFFFNYCNKTEPLAVCCLDVGSSIYEAECWSQLLSGAIIIDKSQPQVFLCVVAHNLTSVEI